MDKRSWQYSLVLALGLVLFAGRVQAQDQRFEIGPRLSILSGSGKPTNDIPQAGAFFRYRLKDHWWLGFSIENSDEFDIEGAAELVGLVQDPDAKIIDAKGSATSFNVWVERLHGNDELRLRFFWTAGAGFNSVDVAPVTGPLADGGAFDIRTDAGSEMILSVGGGLRWYLGAHHRSALELSVRGDQRFADWTLVDHRSGATSTIDDYFLGGLHLGWSFRF